MNWLIVFVALYLFVTIGVAIVTVGLWRKHKRTNAAQRADATNDGQPDLTACQFVRTHLHDDRETLLYERLRAALPNSHVFTHVQLAHLVQPSVNQSNTRPVTDDLNRLSVDFVVCNKDMKTVSVIDLQARRMTHAEPPRITQYKKRIFGSAGLTLIRLKSVPEVRDIRDTLLKHQENSRSTRTPAQATVA